MGRVVSDSSTLGPSTPLWSMPRSKLLARAHAVSTSTPEPSTRLISNELLRTAMEQWVFRLANPLAKSKFAAVSRPSVAPATLWSKVAVLEHTDQDGVSDVNFAKRYDSRTGRGNRHAAIRRSERPPV